MSLFKELQRRNVFRVTVAYIISAWLLAQVADLVLDNIDAPGWVMQTILLVLALGLAPVVFFSWAYEVTPEGIKRESEVDRSASVTHVTGRKLDRAIMLVLVIAVAYFAIDKFVLAPEKEPAPATDSAAATATLENSIAVLPFVNMSADEANEYFSDGLSEELLNVLARNPALQVAARTSSFSLKGEKLEIGEIAKRLKVSHVLEGSVRKSGDRVRITAQLIRADNGYHLWSDTWDRNLDDIFAVQDEIAARITAALLPHIVGDEAAAATAGNAGYQPDASAYQRYLLARDHYNRRDKTEIQKAYDLLKELVREHPDYAEAQALFAAVSFMNARRISGDMPWIIVEPQVRRALDKAYALNPELPEIYLVEGMLKISSRDPETAIGILEKAIELNPSYAEAYRYLSQAAMDAGRKERAWEALETARRLDPISVTTLSWVFRQASDNDNQPMADEAMAVLRELAPETADDLQLHFLQDRGRLAEAAIAIENYRARWPDASSHDTQLASAYAGLGMIDEAMAVDRVSKARIAAELGDADLALATMEEVAAGISDPHDRADVYWNTYLALGRYDEALQVLSDLWYGYADEDMGPKMDYLDVWVFIQLLQREGRTDEAKPIASMLAGLVTTAGTEGGPELMMIEGRIDDVMDHLLERAGNSRFPARYTRPAPFYIGLEGHPDYPKLEALFEAHRAEQRALYDELKRGQSKDETATP